jgi:peptidoglycan/xylan/chitin deacetylase (PgdA/CDA1 family)
MLRWTHVRDLDRRGITIGSHTLTHPMLSALDHAQVERELVDSRARLEAVLGHPVRLFAYPFGKGTDFTEHVKRAVQKAGYAAACTTIDGGAGLEPDPFELRRVKIGNEPVWVFATRLLAAERGSRLLAWIARE